MVFIAEKGKKISLKVVHGEIPQGLWEYRYPAMLYQSHVE